MDMEKNIDADDPEPVAEGSAHLEPTQDEMERERLTARAEQLQDEIQKLHADLELKEAELSEVKKQLGITPFVEFKQSVVHGFHVIGDKLKEVQDTQAYQKTKSTLSEGGKMASDAFSSAGTKIKENETMKAIGEKTSAAFKRTGTVIKDTGTKAGTKISSAAYTLKEKVMGTSMEQGDEATPTSNEEDTQEPKEDPKPSVIERE